ncbi:ATP-binding protein [Caldimonas thermodepolymerans]|uniref:PAS domain-containing sensor histidine kinase n=1 Tax=Caldimonas thermodepolymerans TaxID=215580 RepID=UPI00301552FF
MTRKTPPSLSLPDLPLPASGEGMDEAAWLEVIQKMDEVYSQLIQDEIELERKNAELEQSHQFIFSVLGAMSDLVVACSEAGEIQETNEALRTLCGKREEELIGRPVQELLAHPEAEADRVHEMMARAAAPGLPSDREPVELHLRDASGQAVPVEVRCSPRHDGAGVRLGHVFVGRPVGELRRAYQQLQEAHEALKRTQQQLLHSEKMASLGLLVAGVAHELNNPISFVLGNVHALKRYCERIAAYIDAVHAGQDARQLQALRQQLRIDHMLADMPSLIDGTIEGATRTAEIVNGLKRFSAVDREEFQPVELDAVVQRAIHWVGKGAAAANGFNVYWQGAPGVCVRGSAGQLLQVFMNLIQNAMDAVTTAGVPSPELRIEAQCSEDRVVLSFRDNGPGIPPDLVHRIFDPFFTTKPVGKGTGLGLSISYGIVERHGGRLTAHPRPDGAEFRVELPRLR